MSSYLWPWSVHRSQRAGKCQRWSAKRLQPPSVSAWDAAKALRVGSVLLSASSMRRRRRRKEGGWTGGGGSAASRQRWRTLLTSAAAFNRYLSVRERGSKWTAARGHVLTPSEMRCVRCDHVGQPFNHLQCAGQTGLSTKIMNN